MEAEKMECSEDEELMSRPYQTELEDIAVTKNTIIHLPTGSGKTFIAIHLINRFRDALKPPWGEGGKRTFFLVNTVPLVEQQKKAISAICAVKSVAGYSGDDGVDYWDKDKWDKELAENQVIVMTSQILADMLTHAYIRIQDINLVIFDECHHAVIDHPMRLIMKHFGNCPVDKLPRVVGLTATLLNGNVGVNKVEGNLRELEKTFRATIATSNEMDVVYSYSTNPQEVIYTYKATPLTQAASEAIAILTELQGLIQKYYIPPVVGDRDIKLKHGEKDITTDPKKIIKIVYNMAVHMATYIKEFGVYGGALGILAYTILLERLKRRAISIEEENLYKFTITHATLARAILLKSMEKENGFEKIEKHSSDKVLKLLKVLKEYNPDLIDAPGVASRVNNARKTLSGIIFTKQRFTAKILYNLLKEVKRANPAAYGFLKHEFIVGFNVNPKKSTREDYFIKKYSETALLKFSNKELNLLIATSVIEEGVDIPQCLLVMKYDPPMEYRSYIQSKGRARSNLSTYVMLIGESEKDKFMSLYYTYQKVEKHIKELLVGKTDDRDGPTDEEISQLFTEDEIPPYVTEHGTRLLPVSAISLLNRYCMMLPQDQFTCITPKWVQENVRINDTPMKVVHIYMPISCPVKEKISGKPLVQIKTAKRSAALNVCIRLHQEGELDKITLLPIRYGVVNYDDEAVNNCFPNWRHEEATDGTPKPGTKKMIRRHEKVFPGVLNGPTNWTSGNKAFYLHVIQFETSFAVPTDTREKACYELLHREEGFGFLTPNALPKICDFPMFVMMGEIKTSLKVNYAVVPLDKNLFDMVKYFHFFLFDQVLSVAKKFVVFDGSKNAMYVVPLKSNDGFDIDWDVMMTYTEIPPLAPPTPEERRNLRVRPEDYDKHIVSPWYRGTILPTRYVVSKVLEYKTPQSQFDAETPSITFEDYYLTKYNLEIFGDKNQPLLEVRHLSSKMNCLFPRSTTIKEHAFTERQRKLINAAHGDDAVKQFPEQFIPEFCIKYDFPAVLWYKATILPCIVHRVTMLLVAYELRAEIAKDTKYGVQFLKPDEEWEPIATDMQVAIKSMLSAVEDRVPHNNIDRINNPIDESTATPKIVSMKETIYQLKKQKINQDYPWEEEQEPIDIERHISTVTVMDIECYDEFVCLPMSRATVDVIHSPRREQPSAAAAICAPPLSKTGNIKLLSRIPKGRGPELRDVLAAITTIKSHDTFNLERAETLGDSFLKFIASLYLFHKFPNMNEGQLTNIKGRLIGNRNLYYAGERLRLAGRMKVEQFSPRKDFLMPGFFAHPSIKESIQQHQIRPTVLLGTQVSQEEALRGELTPETLELVTQRFADTEKEPPYDVQNSMQCYLGAQAVPDKAVADCVEALLGTYLQAGGLLAGIKVLEFFKVLTKEENVSNMLRRKIPTVLTEKRTTVAEVYRVLNNCHEEVEQIMEYKFQDPSLLLEALSHPSYIRNRFTRGYERLEFLGDAILDFLVTAHIFELGQNLKPGELTDLRSALVNNVTFASYVVKLGLHKCICIQLNAALEGAIINFVEHQQRRHHALEEDVLHLIDEADCQVAEYVEVPKLLSDVFESLAAAIYLDSGGDLQVVWKVYYRIMKNDINKFFACIPKQPVRLLHENIHACPVFGKPNTINPDIQKMMVPVTFTKDGVRHTVHGVGNNKFEAKRAAAKIALKVLSL